MNHSNSAQRNDKIKLLECVEISTADKPEFSVIWLHGLGADGNDFGPIVPHLGLPANIPVRFIFPHALLRPVTINGGAVTRAWYDIIDFSTSKGQDEAGIKQSVAQIHALIELERDRGIEASNIVLAGFSQGGAIALHVALRYPEKLAGIMALSAYLLFPERLLAEQSDANDATPVFIGHGIHDPMVPLQMGQEIQTTMNSGQHPVEWHSYPIQHSVSEQEITDIGNWLRARFSSDPRQVGSPD